MSLEIGVREFRTDATSWLKKVENGEEITVTRHGQPIARVIPASVSDELIELVKTGKLRPGSGKLQIPTPEPALGKGKSASTYVSDGRR